jgi:concanavalin A-like lectin/glucanase superfamily protein
MPSTRTFGRVAAITVAMVGGLLLPHGVADAASFGASWQMNEKSGPALDSTGNGNDGKVIGGVVRTGRGYDFNGSSGYVSVPNSASLNPGSAPITLTAKFSLDGNPAPSGTDYDIVRKGLAGTKGGDYKMEVLSTGAALCRFHGTKAVELRGGTNLGTGTHVVKCVKTSSSVKLIVDGATKASSAVAVGPISNTSGVFLAAKPGDDFTDGLIDYITIT